MCPIVWKYTMLQRWRIIPEYFPLHCERAYRRPTGRHTHGKQRLEPFTWTHPNGKHANDDKLFQTLNKTASFIFMLYSCKSARAMLFALTAIYTRKSPDWPQYSAYRPLAQLGLTSACIWRRWCNAIMRRCRFHILGPMTRNFCLLFYEFSLSSAGGIFSPLFVPFTSSAL